MTNKKKKMHETQIILNIKSNSTILLKRRYKAPRVPEKAYIGLIRWNLTELLDSYGGNDLVITQLF